MKSISRYFGLDVSKPFLDLALDGSKKTTRFTNTEEGADALAKGFGPGDFVAMERTGGYERLVLRKLKEAGVAACAYNPCRVKEHSHSMGHRAKTDALDALRIAEAGKALPAPSFKTQEREELCGLSRCIQDVKSRLADVRKKMKVPGLSLAHRASLYRQAESLKTEIKVAGEEFKALVLSSPLAEEYLLAQTVPGVGAVTARVVVTELSEGYAELDRGKVTCYAGLAPLDNASGKTVKAKRLAKGNWRLKAAFYMPALRAVRNQEWAKTLYARLRSQGKSHQSALVPVMRRLLVRVFAVLKRGTPWQDVPPIALE